jgi:hypothetical protein
VDPNLDLNEKDAMKEQGELWVEADKVALDDKVSRGLDLPLSEDVKVRIRETGQGISPDQLSRTFEPFFTTKDAQQASLLVPQSKYEVKLNHENRVSELLIRLFDATLITQLISAVDDK